MTTTSLPESPTAATRRGSSVDQITPPRGRRRNGGVVALLLIVALAGVVRLAMLDRTSLWPDELFSLAIATGHSIEHPAGEADPAFGDYVEPPAPVTPAAIAAYAEQDAVPADFARVTRATLKSDTSPPLYYIVLSYWMRAFGGGDASLRILSIVLSLVCIPFVWATGAALGGRRAGLVAAALFAMLPFVVYYSTEGRMYSLLWIAAAGNLWATVRLTRRGDVPALLVWTLTAIAGLLTHYFFAFTLASTGLWLLIAPGRARRWWAITAGIVAGLAVLPWYAHLPEQMAAWRITGHWMSLHPGGFRRSLAVPRVVYSFFSPTGTWSDRAWFIYPGTLAWFGLACVLFWCNRNRWKLARVAMPAFIWFGTIAGVIAFDVLRHTYAIAVYRYVSAAVPAAIVIAAVLISRLPSAWMRRTVAAAVVALSMGGLAIMSTLPGRWNLPIREAAARVAAVAAPNDLIIIQSIPTGQIAFARALRDVGVDGPNLLPWTVQLNRRSASEDMPRFTAGRPGVVYVRFHVLSRSFPAEQWLSSNAILRHAEMVGDPLVPGPIRVKRFELAPAASTSLASEAK